MSWSRRIAATLLRHAVSPLSNTRASLTCAAFFSGPRQHSRLSHTSTNTPAQWDVKEVLGKALDFPGLTENRNPAKVWAEKSASLDLRPPSDTWTGRRVTVLNGDLHLAFQQLHARLRNNNVAKELRLTARHEKKGDKRARLRSERWRKRFADAVRQKVQLVSTIRRRGG